MLDIGCGCGDTSLEIARRVGSHGHVHGIDISGLILDEAGSQSKPINGSSLPLEVAANHVPLPPPSGPEELGAFSFGDANRVVRILAAAGFVDTSIEGFDTTINVGASLDEVLIFLTHLGPASIAIEAPDVDDTSRARIVAELHARLRRIIQHMAWNWTRRPGSLLRATHNVDCRTDTVFPQARCAAS